MNIFSNNNKGNFFSKYIFLNIIPAVSSIAAGKFKEDSVSFKTFVASFSLQTSRLTMSCFLASYADNA